MAATARETQYARLIRDDLTTLGFIGRYDPRHIEAYMRLECGTLDGMSAFTFSVEVRLAAECIDAGGMAAAESLALSYAL